MLHNAKDATQCKRLFENALFFSMLRSKINIANAKKKIGFITRANLK